MNCTTNDTRTKKNLIIIMAAVGFSFGNSNAAVAVAKVRMLAQSHMAGRPKQTYKKSRWAHQPFCSYWQHQTIWRISFFPHMWFFHPFFTQTTLWCPDSGGRRPPFFMIYHPDHNVFILLSKLMPCSRFDDKQQVSGTASYRLPSLSIHAVARCVTSSLSMLF